VSQQGAFDSLHAKAQRLIDDFSKDDVSKVKAIMKQMGRLWSELYNRSVNDQFLMYSKYSIN